MFSDAKIDECCDHITKQYEGLQSEKIDEAMYDDLRDLNHFFKNPYPAISNSVELKSEVGRLTLKFFKRACGSGECTPEHFIRIKRMLNKLQINLIYSVGHASLKSIYVLELVQRITQNLVDNREIITDLADYSKRIISNKHFVSFNGFNLRYGLCEFITNVANTHTELEKGVLQRLYSEFITVKGVSRVYPICVGTYDSNEAERQFDTNPIKWGSDPYGQARWQFVEEFNNYIKDLITHLELLEKHS